MTPEQWEELRKRTMTAEAPKPDPVIQPPAPAPTAPPTTPKPAALSYADILARSKAQRAETETVQGAVPPTSMLIGDVLDLDPSAAPSEATAAFLRQLQAAANPAPGVTGSRASPFSFEPGVQRAGDLRMVPLQRASGEFGIPPSVMEKTLRELRFMQDAKRGGLPPITGMTPEQYQATVQSSTEQARRDTARILGESERRKNVEMPVDPTKVVDDTMSGATMPWYLYPTPVGAQVLGYRARQAAGLELPWDEATMSLLRPWLAESRPGLTTADVEGGAKVQGAAKESPLWWMLRTGSISVPLYSWLLDPEATWELGGETGYGGRRQVERIITGYDPVQDIPVLGRMIDPLGEKSGVYPHATSIIMGTMLLEPDVFSVATLGLGKAYDAFRLSKQVLKGGENFTATAVDALREGKSVHEVWSMAKTDAEKQILREVIRTTQAELTDVAPSATKLGQNMRGIEGVTEAVADELTAAEAAVETATKRVPQAAEATSAAIREASDAAKELRQAEDALIGSRAMQGGLDDLAVGDRVVDRATGEVRRFVRYTSQNGKQMLVLADEAGEEVGVPFGRALRMATAESVSDSQTVLRELQAAKRGYNETMKAMKAAVDAGDRVQAVELAKQARVLRQKMVKPTATLSGNIAEARYLAAREAAVTKMKALEKLNASDKHVRGAVDALQAAVAGRDAKKIELEALQKAHERLLANMEKARESFKAAQKAPQPSPAAGKSALDSVVTRSGDMFEVNPAAWRAAMVQKYGADAVERWLSAPQAAPMLAALESGTHMVNIRGLEALRDLETGVGHSAETISKASTAIADRYLAGIREGRYTMTFTPDGALALAYQMASWLSRGADWVKSSALGTASEPIRRIGRRSFERFARLDHDLGTIARQHGAPGIEAWLLTHTPFDNVISNLAPMTIADRAVLYLRAIAGGDTWGDDLVVKALATAAMPKDQVTQQAVGAVAGRLRSLVLDETVGGERLWDFMKQEAPSIQRGVAGAVDFDDTILRFASRAIAQGSNQYDTLQELARVAGPQLTRNDIEALNWFVHGEVASLKKIGANAAERASEVARIYGVPYRHQIAGNLTSWFTAQEMQVRLVKAGEIEGKGVYLPAHIVSGLNDIPVKLSKEMQEFHQTAWLKTAFDKLSRNWRMVAVNGWLLPRPAIFLTNFLGDWAQMTTSVGLVEATRISIQAAPGYIPFVGPRIEKLFDGVRTKTILPALLDRNVNALMRGSDTAIIETSEGVMSHRRFLQEAIEDGCFGSIASNDLLEALSRNTTSLWKKYIPNLDEPTELIKGSARMLEEAQSRSRLMLYMDARTGRLNGKAMGRQAARDTLVDALYDWRTGVPAHEHRFISRLFAFWTFRRGMMTQGMNALMEGFAEPGLDFAGRALTGRTKLARMRQVGRGVIEAPDMAAGWQDPEQPLDDYAQLDMLGRNSAPWWAQGQTFLGGMKMSDSRKLWYSEVAGRDASYDAIILPTLTTMDQLVLLNTMLQTTMATTVMAAEAAGIPTKMTTVDAQVLAERNIDTFTEMLIPYADDAVRSALYNLVGSEVPGTTDRGVPVPRAQAIVLRRILDGAGMSHFMAAHEDAKGQLRMDRTMYGHLTNLLLSAPQVQDVARTWAVFDNPSMQESLVAGIAEALGAWSGAVKLYGHDPMQSRTYEAQKQEREFKELRSTLEKEVQPGIRR